ncbi:encapsulating protein for peroxidase [Nitrosomonas nitrosa]|uniref:encapsulin n=1 Tax=Nitrosomonas nitrosa TaxID=52442 RepID=UPI000D311A5F|nr:family 1 encapsulin nanocompartment shell protein [Nitrosomonas nitrosa]PTQ88342.1 encapsulating protein for peroxidase [Nitrosomonas nitrosa]
MANDSLEFNWDAYKESLNQLAHDVAKENHVMRPLLKLYGEQGKWARNIVRNKITADDNGPLTVSIDEQNLTPVTLSREIKVEREQFGDVNVLNRLVRDAAVQIANAEDAIILLGNNVSGKLGAVEAKHLNKQTGLLEALSSELPKNQSVAESVRQGITELVHNRCVGNYAAVVSIELFTQAKMGRQNASDTEFAEISDFLTKGFSYSPTLEGRTGVMMSLTSDGIMLAVPVDISVQLIKVEKDAFLEVVEQIRLVIDKPEAIVPLRPINNNPSVK